MHPWHDIHSFSEQEGTVRAVIEIPKHSKAKFEIDKESGLLKLDRMLFAAVRYPANYGFIPQTFAGDNDPLDILVFCQAELPPLCLVEARVIGVMRMRDKEETDDKILAVAANDVSFDGITSLEQLPPWILQETLRFFQDYKALEKMNRVVIEETLDAKSAWSFIEEARELYRKTFLMA
jgi:inorganic pyrophosphatase